MKFTRIIGKIDQKLIMAAEDHLSKMFLDLGVRYNNQHTGSCLGGDPVVFSLLYPVEHVCTLNMPTAATDGKRFYWNPKFVLKHSIIGLRIIAGHEAWHSLYMHPSRRGSRIPKLWNIAVDYIVNGNCMSDLKARGKDPKKEFTTHLGKYMTLNEYAELLKNPFASPMADQIKKTVANTDLPNPNDDRDLTEKEIKELERRDKKEKFYFADPGLDEEMKSPEKIYNMLYQLLPKCPKCGKVGIYKLPKKNDQQEQDKKNKSKEDHKCDDKCNHDNDCDCSDGFDIFGFGDLTDDHMDSEETEEKTAKRVSDAIEAAKRMAGKIPAGLEDELGKLTAPKISWRDIIRFKLSRARAGHGKVDFTRFKSKPMFAGMLTPKKRNTSAKFITLLDTSGSMSRDDMARGVSQLAALDERSEGIIVCADSTIYWSDATKINRASADELSKIKIVGRGGTVFSDFFSDYEKNIGKCDLIIVITDGYLIDTDLANMKNPGVDTVWLITSDNSTFKAPFGKVLNIND